LCWAAGPSLRSSGNKLKKRKSERKDVLEIWRRHDELMMEVTM
jgi:hypothetical protein